MSCRSFQLKVCILGSECILNEIPRGIIWMILSSTHTIVGFIDASRGLHLSHCNPTLVLSNAICMVSTIDTLISTLSYVGSSSWAGNIALWISGGQSLEGGEQTWGPYKPQDAHTYVPHHIHKISMACLCNLDACAAQTHSKVVLKNIARPSHGGGTCPTPW